MNEKEVNGTIFNSKMKELKLENRSNLVRLISSSLFSFQFSPTFLTTPFIIYKLFHLF